MLRSCAALLGIRPDLPARMEPSPDRAIVHREASPTVSDEWELCNVLLTRGAGTVLFISVGSRWGLVRYSLELVCSVYTPSFPDHNPFHLRCRLIFLRPCRETLSIGPPSCTEKDFESNHPPSHLGSRAGSWLSTLGSQLPAPGSRLLAFGSLVPVPALDSRLLTQLPAPGLARLLPFCPARLDSFGF